MAQASNLAVRFATAVVAVPVILALVYPAPPWAFWLLVLAATVLGTGEMLAMTHPRDRTSQAAGVAIAAAVSAVLYWAAGDARAVVSVLLVAPVLGPLVTLARLGAMETAAFRAAAMGFGPLFIAAPLASLAVIRRDAGSGFTLLALGLAWLGDTGAYFAGRLLGRRKLYEAVSPKKTIEGAVGGLLASVVWAVFGALVYLRGALPLAHAVPLAVVAGALGQAGDLGESLFKRSTGIKDSGAIVPGHGGILDRVDALMMTSLVVLLYTLWLR